MKSIYQKTKKKKYKIQNTNLKIQISVPMSIFSKKDCSLKNR